MDLQAVLFDYGHTLLDFTLAEDDLLDAYEGVRALLTARAYRDLPESSAFVEALTRRIEREVFESYRRRELEELDIVHMFDRGLQVLGLTLPRPLVREIAEIEHRALAARLRSPEENLAVLRTLRGEGLKIGVVSNAHFLPDLMRHDLERLGIAPLVDAAVFSAEIGVRKPHPAIFLKVLDAIQVPPEQALFVGDRLHDDIGGATGLGMRAVLTHQFRQEDVEPSVASPLAVIASLPELLPIVLPAQ